MSIEQKPEANQELVERFDREIRREILDASNDYRKEHGLPLITEDEVSHIDTLSGLRAKFGGNEETEESK